MEKKNRPPKVAVSSLIVYLWGCGDPTRYYKNLKNSPKNSHGVKALNGNVLLCKKCRGKKKAVSFRIHLFLFLFLSVKGYLKEKKIFPCASGKMGHPG